MQARVRLAKVMLAADRLGFVRRYPGIAGLARVRLAEIVQNGLRRRGHVRRHRGAATGTRRFPQPIFNLVLSRVAEQARDAPGLLVDLGVRVRLTIRITFTWIDIPSIAPCTADGTKAALSQKQIRLLNG
jgi:hypothetical protein